MTDPLVIISWRASATMMAQIRQIASIDSQDKGRSSRWGWMRNRRSRWLATRPSRSGTITICMIDSIMLKNGTSMMRPA